MESERRLAERRVADLRERMRITLDRSALPALREKLMAEILRFNALGGVDDACLPHRLTPAARLSLLNRGSG